jgi:Lrp/AsnC family transcriptional regulator for asnA, asnC and gidA
MAEKISLIDLKILNYMLENDSQNLNKIAKDLEIPAVTVYGRIRYLKQKGIIKRMAPELDLEKLGLPTLALIEIEVENHRDIDQLEKKYGKTSNIVWSFKVVGNYDYLLAGYFSSPKEMEKLLNDLAADPLVKDVHGNIVSHINRFVQAPYPLKEG